MVTFALPKQELWIFDHLKDLKIPVAVVVEGSVPLLWWQSQASGFVDGRPRI